MKKNPVLCKSAGREAPEVLDKGYWEDRRNPPGGEAVTLQKANPTK